MHADNPDWQKAKLFFKKLTIILFGLTPLAIAADPRITAWLHERPDWVKVLGKVVQFPESYGRYAIHLLILAIVLSSLNRRQLLKGYLAAYAIGCIVTPIKYLVGRARPSAHLGVLHFEPFAGLGKEMSSFPSGDASAVMILCGLMSLYFPRARVLFIILGCWCALGRVTRGRHFLSDVLAGAAFGLLSLLLAMKLLGPACFAFHEHPQPLVDRAEPISPSPPQTSTL
jgi:membrane-associated phospholipid phosphatase